MSRLRELYRILERLMPIEVAEIDRDRLGDALTQDFELLQKLLEAFHDALWSGLSVIQYAAVDWEPGRLDRVEQGEWHGAPTLLKGLGTHCDRYVRTMGLFSWLDGIKITDFIFKALPAPVSLFVRVTDNDEFSCVPSPADNRGAGQPDSTSGPLPYVLMRIPRRNYERLTQEICSLFEPWLEEFRPGCVSAPDGQSWQAQLNFETLTHEATEFLQRHWAPGTAPSSHIAMQDAIAKGDEFVGNVVTHWASAVVEAYKQLGKQQAWGRDDYVVKNDDAINLCRTVMKALLYGGGTEVQVDYLDYWAVPAFRYRDRPLSFLGLFINMPTRGRAQVSSRCEHCGADHVYNCNDAEDLMLFAGTAWALRRWGRKSRKEVLYHGTRSAVAAIVGRNLSHNLGSHSLQALEDDFSQLGTEAETLLKKRVGRVSEDLADSGADPRLVAKLSALADSAHPVTETDLEIIQSAAGEGGTPDLAIYSRAATLPNRCTHLFRNLRERMDLVAASAFYFPPSTRTLSFEELLKGLKHNQLLLASLARTERVQKIEVDCDEPSRHFVVAIPGSALGKQALYGLVENIARDAAKYGGVAAGADRSCLKLTLQVTELGDEDLATAPADVRQECQESLLRVVIRDGRPMPRAVFDSINKELEGISSRGPCNEHGRISTTALGLLERFVFSAYLRGITSPKEMWPQEGARPGPTQPPLLKLVWQDQPGGEAAWVLYLLKPKKLLVVSGDASAWDALLGKHASEGAERWNWRQALERSERGAVRHEYVVLDIAADVEEDLERAERIAPYLPCRVFVFQPGCRERSIAIGARSYPALAERVADWKKLADVWLAFLASRKNVAIPEVLHLADNSRFPVSEVDLDTWVASRPVAVFDRHGTQVAEYKDGMPPTVLLYEPFQSGWPVEYQADLKLLRAEYESRRRVLAEAALARILIVDERLDESLQAAKYAFHIPVDARARTQTESVAIDGHQLWRWKGIDVIGTEFQGQGTGSLTPELIYERVRAAKNERRPYDFVIVHLGILDKFAANLKREKPEFQREFVQSLSAQGDLLYVLMLSGRGGDHEPPPGTRFIHLSSVEAWFWDNQSKADIVSELTMIRTS